MEGKQEHVYDGREQTAAKHFILKRYLQALAFKVLTFADITYVDGFSGPWETRTEDFSDSSFMIAIQVLKDAQARILQRDGMKRQIRCFFSENNPAAYAQLASVVSQHHNPSGLFEVETYSGDFVNAVPQIRHAIGRAFPLIFIDPTGWTGYPFDRIRTIFDYGRCEVLINFMYDFVNRFVASEDESTVASLDPILGGPGWKDRLDETIPRGLAVEKLFRETLKAVGRFQHVVSTKIDKSTADRPHFFLAYGTKSRDGLKTFRQIEYDALKEHARNRANAKEKLSEQRSNALQLFPGHDAEVQAESVDDLVREQKRSAAAAIENSLIARRQIPFPEIVDRTLEAFLLRETNVKDICVELADAGKVERTWGGGVRKPRDTDIIRLK
jgi:three-Cys-motif partner protein